MKPLIVINLKTYENGTGYKAKELALIAQEITDARNSNIIFAVQATDIYNISQSVKYPIYAQHIDAIPFGSHTGYILPESVKESGAAGTLLNHSERKITLENLEKSIKRAKDLGLIIIACADTPDEAEAIAAFSPDYIAVEPPELIGGDISISTSKPEVITETIKLVRKVNPDIKILVGAGIKTGKDVKKALELGAVGILLASGVTQAKDPKKVLEDLDI
ncbi:MAG: triose-phosphate isomerase [DPANN group archaeon]|nr:triose-phosphate isomerase [DPANN group archaeon]